uniref:Transmembrane protein n=1 Tax=Angiostrongylus cantonensis TaxID=6313 RepID=A0A0K0D150_ANGCA
MVATKKRACTELFIECCLLLTVYLYAYFNAAGRNENDSGEGKTLSEVKKTDLALVRVVESMKQEQSAYENFGPSGGEVEGADNAKRAARQKSQRTPKTAKIAQKLGGDFDVECTQRNTQQLALHSSLVSLNKVNKVKTEAIKNKAPVVEKKSTSQDAATVKPSSAEVKQGSAEVKHSSGQDGKKSSRRGDDQKPDSIRKRKRKDGDSTSIQDNEGKSQENLALLAAAEQMALDKGDYDNFGPPGKP